MDDYDTYVMARFDRIREICHGLDDTTPHVAKWEAIKRADREATRLGLTNDTEASARMRQRRAEETARRKE